MVTFGKSSTIRRSCPMNNDVLGRLSLVRQHGQVYGVATGLARGGRPLGVQLAANVVDRCQTMASCPPLSNELRQRLSQLQ
jgi:hypothetical protein